MSTLVAQTISNGTVSTSSANVIQGSAKAWVNFNGNSGASPVVRASYNVSSVTRNSLGDYTITMTNALADANYSYIVAAGANSTNWLTTPVLNAATGPSEVVPTSSAFRFVLVLFNGTNWADSKYINIAVFSS